ncbi:hypothetical protein Misp03_80930 [Microbispora sp. NBRC 16548]|nr:hypothetical protein Misp03_80930 [Microbispora sp. NBRC 16548]
MTMRRTTDPSHARSLLYLLISQSEAKKAQAGTVSRLGLVWDGRLGSYEH